MLDLFGSLHFSCFNFGHRATGARIHEIGSKQWANNNAITTPSRQQ